MSRPSKPISVITNEKKCHRTKKEIKQREQAEKSLETGEYLKERDEVKSDANAHKEFARIKLLLVKLDKNDALFEGIINRYCLLTSECLGFEERIKKLTNSIKQLENDYAEEKIEAEFYYNKIDSLQKSIINYDKQIMTKRKMLLDIEKENIMTIASALRSIPKKVEDKSSKLLEALM